MIVIDTHVWIWLASDPDRLSGPADQQLDAATTIGVPAIATWEVATIVAKECIRLDRRPRRSPHRSHGAHRERLARDPRRTDSGLSGGKDRLVTVPQRHVHAERWGGWHHIDPKPFSIHLPAICQGRVAEEQYPSDELPTPHHVFL